MPDEDATELEYGTKLYKLQYHYALPQSAWHVELSEAVPAPQSWAGIPGARSHLPGRAIVVGVVPDEDFSEPVRVSFDPQAGPDIPYVVMQWFMAALAKEVERNRPPGSV